MSQITDFNSWLTAFIGSLKDAPTTAALPSNVVALHPPKPVITTAQRYGADAGMVEQVSSCYAELTELCLNVSCAASSPAIRELMHAMADEMERTARIHRLKHWANVCRHSKSGGV